MKPLVSVIVPVYKVEEYLPKCINSILNQTYRNLEVILVDDGSPDNCGALCDQYAEQDARVRVIHRENGGISAARNSGLEIMQGDYLIFVDSDDWLAMDAVQVLYDRLQQDDSDVAMGQVVKIYEDGQTSVTRCAETPNLVISGAEGLTMLASGQGFYSSAWAKLMKRSIFENIRFPKLCRGEDLWVLPHILEICRKISLERTVVYYYYQRNTSIVHDSKDNHWADNAKASFHVSQFLLERGLWKDATVYCLSGMAQLQHMKDQQEARKCLQGGFAVREWMRLILCRPKCLLYILALYCPKLFQLMCRLWKRMRQKEN